MTGLPADLAQGVLDEDLHSDAYEKYPRGHFDLRFQHVAEYGPDIGSRERHREGHAAYYDHGRTMLTPAKERAIPTASASMLVAMARMNRT